MPTAPDQPKPEVNAADYGRSLAGLGINLMVRDLPRSLEFARDVLQAEVFHDTDKFAALRLKGADYMLHTDDTVHANPMRGLLSEGSAARRRHRTEGLQS